MSSVLLGFLLPLLGVAAGLVALRQIARTGERGRNAARAAIAIGAVASVILVVVAGWLLLRTPAVSKADLEAQIVSQSGLAPDQVRCPEALPARVGASVVCSASAGGHSQPLTVTATSVDGDQVRFDIALLR